MGFGLTIKKGLSGILIGFLGFITEYGKYVRGFENLIFLCDFCRG